MNQLQSVMPHKGLRSVFLWNIQPVNQQKKNFDIQEVDEQKMYKRLTLFGTASWHFRGIRLHKTDSLLIFKGFHNLDEKEKKLKSTM